MIVRVIGYPTSEADWLGRFKNFGEDVYLALREHCTISIQEIDAAIDSFCVPVRRERDGLG